MASACSTHPTSPSSPRSPRARPSAPTPLLSNLPKAWQTFASDFGLNYRDVLGLMSYEPVPDLDAEKLVAIVNQLEAALRADDWPLSEAMLCMLVRSDLRPVFDAACSCGLGWVATVASRKNQLGNARGDFGSTARLGHVLTVQLKRLVETAVAARACADAAPRGKRKRAS